MGRCGNYVDFIAALTQLIELLNTGKIAGQRSARAKHELDSPMSALAETTYHAVRAVRGRYIELRRCGTIDETQCICAFRDTKQRAEFEALSGTMP